MRKLFLLLIYNCINVTMIIVCVLREYQHCMSSSLCGCFLAFFRYLNIYSPTICIKAFVEEKKRLANIQKNICTIFVCTREKREEQWWGRVSFKKWICWRKFLMHNFRLRGFSIIASDSLESQMNKLLFEWSIRV